jgi:hypothetical protein
MTEERDVAVGYVRLFGRLMVIEVLIYWLPLITGGVIVLSFIGFWPGMLMVVGAPAYRFIRLAGLLLMSAAVVLGTPFWAVLSVGLVGIAYGELLRRYFLPRQRAILDGARGDG